MLIAIVRPGVAGSVEAEFAVKIGLEPGTNVMLTPLATVVIAFGDGSTTGVGG